MLRFVFWSCLTLVIIFSVACATARSIRIKPGEGGEIAISPRDSMEARQKAEMLMRQNCRGKDYKIVNEGEVVVGKQASASGSVDPKGGAFGGLRTSQSSTETNLTEWRIEYSCGK